MREEGDTIVLILHGLVNSEHIEVTHPRSVAVAQRYGYALTMIDARDATSMSAQARRTSADLNRRQPLRSANAIFGANLITRTVATLLWRAVSLISTQRADLAFFATESEALAWLDLQRLKLHALATAAEK